MPCLRFGFITHTGRHQERRALVPHCRLPLLNKRAADAEMPLFREYLDHFHVGNRAPKPAKPKEPDRPTIQFSDEVLAERDATPDPTLGHVLIVRDQPCNVITFRQGDTEAHAFPMARRDAAPASAGRP